MPYSIFDEQWGHVRSMLPENIEDLARIHGAMRRKRGEVKDAETLLRLILMHVGGGLSLEQTAVRAREQGLADLSSVALYKRLRGSEAWLAALTREILQQMPVAKLPVLGDHYRVRALDATFIQEPGSTGTDWRLHYSLKLPELVCDFFEITDAHGAESLKRLPVEKGDVVLADRGYSKRSGIASLLEAGADVVVRLIPSAVPLLNETGERIDLAKTLAETLVDTGDVMERLVWFTHEGKTYRMRLCALRKTKAAACSIRKRAKGRHRKGGNFGICQLCLRFEQPARRSHHEPRNTGLVSLSLADRASLQASQEPLKRGTPAEKGPRKLSSVDASQGAHRLAYRQAHFRK